MKTPDYKEITFTYHSHQTKDRAMWWRARLKFPKGATQETVLELSIDDGLGRAVASGVLELAGREIKIAEGRGELTFADFIAGKHATALWLHRPGMPSIPGALTFA